MALTFHSPRSEAPQEPRDSRMNLTWGHWRGNGEALQSFSVQNEALLRSANMLSPEELQELAETPPVALPYRDHPQDLCAFLERLAAQLQSRETKMIDAMRHETGFTAGDCAEVFGGVLRFLHEFPTHIQVSILEVDPAIHYQSDGLDRSISLTDAPWGTIAAILPQNAFLYLATICLANALAAGNRVALRAPAQSALSAGLLAEAIRDAGAQPGSVSVALAKSKEFLSAFHRSPLPCLIHYLGGSRHAPALLADCFAAGKACLIDGDGNVVMYIGADANPHDAALLLTQGATRYNGQTCASINGAVIHPKIYGRVREALLTHWSLLTFGAGDTQTSVGPLLSAEQAQGIREQMTRSGASLLRGGGGSGNILEPSLLESPDPESTLAREGAFGPVLWIDEGDAERFIETWSRNKYPLCAGVIGDPHSSPWWTERLPGLARLVIDGDPSIEDVFEPWGGYLGSGSNPVSLWSAKYRRILQVDTPTQAKIVPQVK